MKASEVKIGAAYSVKVSGQIAPVRITGKSSYGGWDGWNVFTGRAARIRTAARLRRELPEGKLAYLPEC